MIVVFWKWHRAGYRSKFESQHVNIAAAMVQRNCTKPLDFVCITDDPKGLDKHIRPIALWDNPYPEYGTETRPNCLYRLRAFSDEMIEKIGPSFVWFDLDMVVTGNIDHIINAPEDFAMWGDTLPKLKQYNGSLCLMKAGVKKQVWDDFKGKPSLDEAHRAGFFGSDQAWISHKVGDGERKFGTQDGVYSFNNHYKANGIRAMIDGTKLVFLHGTSDPWDRFVQEKYPWVKQHYRR